MAMSQAQVDAAVTARLDAIKQVIVIDRRDPRAPDSRIREAQQQRMAVDFFQCLMLILGRELNPEHIQCKDNYYLASAATWGISLHLVRAAVATLDEMWTLLLSDAAGKVNPYSSYPLTQCRSGATPDEWSVLVKLVDHSYKTPTCTFKFQNGQEAFLKFVKERMIDEMLTSIASLRERITSLCNEVTDIGRVMDDLK